MYTHFNREWFIGKAFAKYYQMSTCHVPGFRSFFNFFSTSKKYFCFVQISHQQKKVKMVVGLFHRHHQQKLYSPLQLNKIHTSLCWSGQSNLTQDFASIIRQHHYHHLDWISHHCSYPMRLRHDHFVRMKFTAQELKLSKKHNAGFCGHHHLKETADQTIIPAIA